MYLRLGTSDGEIWAAVDAAEVKTGAQVTVVNAITMDGFESKALGRKFDRIVFGSLAGAAAPQAKAPTVPPGRGAAAPAPPAASSQASAGSPMPPQMPAQMAMQMPPGPMPPHPPVSAAPTEGAPITVEKAEGAGGRRVAEIFATRASLKDVVVVVRGKVVKFSSNIMGKNWIHLRDGSGSRAAQDDDLTLTTMDSASVGDIVVVRGVLRVNRDFGAGYSYPVIIEDAKVSK